MDDAQIAAMRMELDRVENHVNGSLAALNGRVESAVTGIAEVRSLIETGLSELVTEVKGLRDYVEQIEREAHEAMNGMMDPAKMMDMAGKFMGLAP